MAFDHDAQKALQPKPGGIRYEEDVDLTTEAKTARLKAFLDALETMPYRSEKECAIAYACSLFQTWPNKPS